MASRLRLKGSAILNIGRGAINAHQLSLRSQKSYPSVSSYTKDPNDLAMIELEMLACILMEGQGLTADEVLDLRLGDLFEIVEAS